MEELRLGDYVSLRPADLPHLTYYGEGSWGLRLNVMTPSKAHRRNLKAYLCFFRIEPCGYVRSGLTRGRGEVVKNGEEVSLCHVHTGKWLMADASEKGVNFGLGEGPQSWLTLQCGELAVGAPLRYSHSVAIISPICSIPHYLSISTIDDISYTATCSLRPALTLLQLQPRSPGLRTHYPLQIRHRELGLFLVIDEDKPKLASWDETSYWTWEPVNEMTNQSVGPGDRYYLRNCASGLYLTSSLDFVPQPDITSAFFLSGVSNEEITINTRDHKAIGCTPDQPLHYHQSYKEYYELETRHEAEVMCINLPAQAFIMEPVSEDIAGYIRTVMDLVECLSDLEVEVDIDVGVGLVQAVVTSLNCGETEKALKQRIAMGAKLVELGLKVPGIWTSGPPLQSLISLLHVLIQDNPQAAQFAASHYPHLDRILSLDMLSGCQLLRTVFKLADLPLSELGSIYHQQLQEIALIDDENVVKQSNLLRLCRRLAEVNGRPARVAQSEILLIASRLVGMKEVNRQICVQIHGHAVVPVSELKPEYQRYVYNAVKLLAAACDGNYQPGLSTLQGLGFTPELLLEALRRHNTPVLIRAALVHLTTTVICAPAATDPSLRRPGNLVFTIDQLRKGPIKSKQTGRVDAVLNLILEFSRQNHMQMDEKYDVLRVIIAYLQQLHLVVMSGLADLRYVRKVIPMLMSVIMALTGVEERFSQWPAEALRRLRKREELTDRDANQVLEWTLCVANIIGIASAEERAFAALSAGNLSAAQDPQSLTTLFRRSDPTPEEVYLRLLFCSTHPSKSIINTAVEEIRLIALSNAVATALSRSVVLRTEEEGRLWGELQMQCQRLRTAIAANTSPKPILTTLLDLLHINAFPSMSAYSKAQRMTWSLNLPDLLSEIQGEVENCHLAWLVALQCIRFNQDLGRKFLQKTSGDRDAMELLSYGLIVNEVTKLAHIGEKDSLRVGEMLDFAMELPHFQAKVYIHFLILMQVRADVQLLTVYRIRDLMYRNAGLEAELYQLLAVACRNATAAECVKSWFRLTRPESDDWGVIQGWAAVKAILYPMEQDTVLGMIQELLMPLRSSGHPGYVALLEIARSGAYTVVWPKATPGLPYRSLPHDSPPSQYLSLWESIYNLHMSGLETGFLTTISMILNGAKATDELGITLNTIHAVLRQMEQGNPDLAFTKIIDVIQTLIPDLALSPPKKAGELPDIRTKLLSDSEHPDPNTTFHSLSLSTLQLDYFLRTDTGRAHFTTAIYHLLTHSDASTKDLLYRLFKEICIIDRQETDVNRELNAEIWVKSGLIRFALEGIKSDSSRIMVSLELLAEVTEGQTTQFQAVFLELFQSTSYDFFCLLQNTQHSLLQSFQRRDTPDATLCRQEMLLLSVLENGCKGSFDPFQRFLQRQSHRKGSINVITLVSGFIIGMLDCWAGSKEQEMMLGKGLDALVTFATGPCLPVQSQLSSNPALLKSLMQILRQIEGAEINPALAHAELRVSILLNTLVEGESQSGEVLIGTVDVELLLRAINRVYERCIRGNEMDTALGRVRDGVVLQRMQFAFLLYTFLLELRDLAPAKRELAVLTEVSHSARGRLRAWLEDHIFPQHYSELSCFTYFAAHTGYVEIQRDSLIATVYFPIPPHCSFLSTASKELLVNINRTDRNEDLQKILLEIPRLEAEMKHQQRLSRWPVLKTLTRLAGPLDTLTLLLIVTINLVFLVEEERETLFALDNQEGTIDPAAYGLAVAIYVSALAHYIAYVIEFYPRVTIETGRNQTLSFQLYPLIPHNDSILMENLVKDAEQTWVRQLPSCLVSILKLVFNPVCLVKLLLIAAAFAAIVYPIIFPFMLLWFLPSYAALRHILKAITMNKMQLLITAMFLIFVVLMFSEVYFVVFADYFTEKNDKMKSQWDTYCGDLWECFTSVLNWGKGNGGVGDAIAQVIAGARSLASRLVLDTFFFIIIDIIIMKIVFGIILDTIASLREGKGKSDRDMYEKCLICRGNRNQLELQGAGWTTHILYEHSLFAYVAYVIYVSHKEKRHCTGLELYVKQLASKSDPDFFPTTSKILLDKGIINS